ncbi:MAG: hypothetical protein EU530_11855 [Promethearchaeota archaeon]|nr:MAG: hypothetical protein EU530_11855 [Candidatus Lokiarchaeota archaeon]
MKKRLSFLTMFLITLFVGMTPITGISDSNDFLETCSIFSISVGDTVYFGSNEDFLLDRTYAWFVPRQNYNISNQILNLPGVMLLGFDHNNHIVDGKFQGGMNEYGLCWDSNGLPPVSMYWNMSGKEVWYFNYSIWIWMQPLLECQNVDDVINWFNTYNLGDVYGGQSHFCDAEGNAVVVSVNSTGNFTYTTMGTNSFLVSTNFNVAWPDNHYDPYPCERYSKVTTMLEELDTEEELTAKACQDVLEAVAVGQTSYSNVFDPVHQEMYLNIYQDFSKTAKVNLHDELAKITPTDKNTLFHDSYYYQQIPLTNLFKKIPGYSTIILAVSSILAVYGLVLFFSRKKLR